MEETGIAARTLHPPRGHVDCRAMRCMTRHSTAENDRRRDRRRTVKDDRQDAMDIHTTRFGVLQIDADDVIEFPRGLLGLEECRQWVLLADAHNDAVGWLQSTDQPNVALAIVSPRRFAPGYQIRVARRDLAPLELDRLDDANVLVVVGSDRRSLTLNLKAPSS